MAECNPENGLRDALAAFETALATPLLSGELDNWIDHVQATWSDVSTHVHDHSTRLHPRQYQEISDADPELMSQVEKLQVEDLAIERDREGLCRRVHGIVQHAPQFEPDEEKVKHHLTQLIDIGVLFVGRARKQEVVVETWFVEAFNRDRGVGD